MWIVVGAIAAGGLLTSCGDEGPWSGSDSEGGVALNLNTDGRVMRAGTRADDNQCPIVPDVTEFAVNLSSKDGAYSRDWATLQSFNNTKSFPIGDYVLTAYAGQKDVEGFELPYYEGKSDVHVSPGELSEVNVTATLQSAMVSIRYTEAFTNNFSAYSAAVQTEGHDWVVFAQNEDRPAFIDATAGEEVKMSLTMTNRQDETVTIEPAKFQAKPRHHYIITVNATGQISNGTLGLDIQFEEEVVAETVNINLGDELFNAPAPTITPKGFTNNGNIDKVECETIATNPQFDIIAFGGFKEVSFKVQSADYTPTFGNEVELVGATSLQQKQLSDEGVNVKGIFKNTGNMAVINVKDFVQNLPKGNYVITLQATDKMTRLSEPVTLNVKVAELVFTATPDAFSHKVVFQMAATEKSIDVLINRVRFLNNGSEIPAANITRDLANNLITVVGLKPATAYNFTMKLGNIERNIDPFTTEAATDVNNGDFEDTAVTIDTRINSGGQYTGTAFSNPKYYCNVKVKRSEATGWASINAKTFYMGANTVNTWFCTPSTYAENGEVTVRTVGYSHTNTLPGVYKKTNVWYNPYAPTFGDNDRAAGELFLGSYAFNGGESRSEGIEFTSRPSSLSFSYRYDSKNNEHAIALIKVLDASGNEIASQETLLAGSTTMKNVTVDLPEYSFGRKAAKLVVKFLSSDAVVPYIYVPTGDELSIPHTDYGTNGNLIGGQIQGDNNYKAEAVGSVLTLDKVKLGYGGNFKVSKAARRNIKK